MPASTIREQTFCCGSGSGVGTDENLEMRLRGGFPRANAVQYVKDRHDVNLLTCICAIDKATLPGLMDYWVPGVRVCGVHELLANALVMEGEADRKIDQLQDHEGGDGSVDDGDDRSQQLRADLDGLADEEDRGELAILQQALAGPIGIFLQPLVFNDVQHCHSNRTGNRIAAERIEVFHTIGKGIGDLLIREYGLSGVGAEGPKKRQDSLLILAHIRKF